MAVPKKKVSRLRRRNKDYLNTYKIKIYNRCRICWDKLVQTKICNSCFLLNKN